MSEILQHREAGVLTLTFNRLDKKNAITTAMYSRLADELEAATGDDSIRVAVIQGAVEIFTAGNDLADFLNNPPVSKPGGEVAPVVRFLNAIRDFPKPIVAAVAGPAVGIGTTLLLHCDLVYAADNARFQLPFVNLALCPEAASSLLLPRLAGHQRAAEMLMLGEAFDAETAREAGIVNRVVATAGLLETAREAARKLAGRSAQSLAVTKALMKRSPERGVREAMDEEAIQFAELVAAPAAKEIFSAFLEKRVPDSAKIHGGKT